MDRIPDSWRGQVLDRWNRLVAMQGILWNFSFETRGDHGDILLKAELKIPSRDNIKLEIVHPPDFGNIVKVCKKIDSLEKKVHEPKSATA